MGHIRFGPNIGSGGAAQFVNDVAKFSLFSMVRRHTARRACSAASASRANVCEITAPISAGLRVRSGPARARAPPACSPRLSRALLTAVLDEGGTARVVQQMIPARALAA
jgi:hypothetical protein